MCGLVSSTKGTGNEPETNSIMASGLLYGLLQLHKGPFPVSFAGKFSSSPRRGAGQSPLLGCLKGDRTSWARRLWTMSSTSPTYGQHHFWGSKVSKCCSSSSVCILWCQIWAGYRGQGRSATGLIRFRRARFRARNSVSILALTESWGESWVCSSHLAKAKSRRSSRNSPSLSQNSVSSLLRNSALRPFPNL